MSYPSFEKYNEAFQLHNKFLTDSELAAGTVRKTGLGTPLAISGGFALTYTIDCNSKKYAVRCFHKESKSLELRYLEISKKIKSLASPFFLDFEFQPNGIRVDGKAYPIVKWRGLRSTLGEFLEDNFDNQNFIKNLGDSLIKLSDYLEQNSIAHGDIQTGNLMVSNTGSSLQLIDYDGMYIDSIASLGSSELGHINFQHPYRAKQNPFNNRLDRFSLILLWLACKSLEIDSKIWGKTKSEFDAIVFRSTDFANPNTSQTFSLLSSYPALKDHVNNFAAICGITDLNDIPNLSNFIQGIGIPSTNNIQIISKNVSRAVVLNEYISPYPVLSALDYNLCLKHIGNQVEVIGKIVEVKQGLTRNNKPYIFINFGDWKGNIFKITIWSEGLDIIANKPNHTWIGKWVSVKGLMEAPFKSKKHKYSHISITLTKKGQLFQIDELEAKKRLISKSLPQNNNSGSIKISNRDILTQIGVGSSSANNSSPTSGQSITSTNSVTKSQNQAILSKIHATSKPINSQPVQSPSKVVLHLF
ncbi:protein kinase family protein [Acinetobacter sp. GSS19]|uniref:protein kinase family protein n=1 Tax=Acinetobacter sp. GSS19 TaxID=3020716 RepID=UPI0023622323|nr:protein kinase family protein [Acinetobacter sp. GSS19]